MWKLPATAAEARDNAERLRKAAVDEFTRALDKGDDEHMQYLLLMSRFAQINNAIGRAVENPDMGRPRELPDADKRF